MILVDLHAHSSGISTCCRCSYREGIDAAKQAGLDGFVLTNHYTRSYVAEEDYDGLARRYLEEYRKAKEYGDSVEFRVFFGIEVTAEQYEGVHFLVYGVPEKFMTEHPQMCNYAQKDLYETVHSYGGILVQAHPLRKVPRLMDLNYLDGVEISCHPGHGSSFFEKVTEIAGENRKILTCGGDYHADVKYRPQCGVFVPDEIADGVKLKDWLIAQKSLTLRVHEPGGEWHDLQYHRT